MIHFTRNADSISASCGKEVQLPHTDSTDRRGRRHPRGPLFGVEREARGGHHRTDTSGLPATTEAVQGADRAAVVGLDSGRARRLLRHALPRQDIR